MSEIRYDQLYDTHVIIAPERLHRPDYTPTGPDEEESAPATCPFCEGNEAMTPPEIFALRGAGSFHNEPGWQTRVVPNLYKALQIEAPHRAHFHELFHHWEGFGAHEVIIDMPRHCTSMRQWNEADTAAWLLTLRTRVSDLRRDIRIAYISIFKNEGRLAGSTQPHSHTQLIGLPIIPHVERERYRRSFEHFTMSGHSLFESLLLQEEAEKTRIVARNGEFTAYCPYASGYPFEVVISSVANMGQVDTLSDTAIASVAALLVDVLRRMERQLGHFDFNLQVVTPPLKEQALPEGMLCSSEHACRFAIRIMPRIYRHGGFEAVTGILINPVAPEMAAKLLREGRDG